MTNILKKFAREFGVEIGRYHNYQQNLFSALDIDCVFDVGANVGYYVISIRENGYFGKVISFEPTINAYSKLIENSKSDARWIVHRRCALGETNGTATINVAGNSWLSSSLLEMGEQHIKSAPDSGFIARERTEVITLDSVYHKYASQSNRVLLKMDVQGYESHVLSGARNSIRFIAAVKLELSLKNLYQGDKLYDYYFNFFLSRGFEIWDLEPGFRDANTGQLLQFDALFVNPNLLN